MSNHSEPSLGYFSAQLIDPSLAIDTRAVLAVVPASLGNAEVMLRTRCKSFVIPPSPPLTKNQF